MNRRSRTAAATDTDVTSPQNAASLRPKVNLAASRLLIHSLLAMRRCSWLTRSDWIVFQNHEAIQETVCFLEGCQVEMIHPIRLELGLQHHDRLGIFDHTTDAFQL